ncbi:MAG: bifunctional 4-hydroxy-3-methylbut-2-enyl diphosphate reductase/30S ribosomal protein S1 [Ruminococcaceae bacterium]|nr:bifunctional 4-hydroxy-3-methylbut-2-enyl diphosphate reductase/30S ribosomal protein S1 [Oscillospiraceae bacterium]
MQITVAKYAGFCFGVERAVSTVQNIIHEHKGKKIYTLGLLIHNPVITEKLHELGVCAIEEDEAEALLLSENVQSCVFVIRAHGVKKELQERLAASGATLIDCTCPFVSKIHTIADEHTEDQTLTLLFGTENHPEVIGIASHIKGDFFIFDSKEKLENFINRQDAQKMHYKKTILVSQTTQNLAEYKNCQEFLKKVCTNPLIFDTICSVTENRQLEVEKLSQKCDAILVIGGKNSSNTKKLFEISRKNNPNTFFAEHFSDIPKNITQMSHVGIAAGASTPGYMIEEVKKIMSEQENFAQLLDESFKTLNTGDKVSGVVTSVSNTEVHVDIGSKVTGILTLENVTDDPTAKLENLFKVGDTVDAIAIRVSDLDGIAMLSKKKVDAQKDWQKVVEAAENETIIEGRITEAVKGGVIAYALSNRIFIPASQTMVARGGDLSSIVGTVQKFKIIEVTPEKRHVVASIRKVVMEERKAAEEAFWAEVEVDKFYVGKVKSLTNYGAFVDLGGVDGMVHTSELSWTRIANPKEVVSVGDEIKVFVKAFDREKGRVSLGYKTEETNPWNAFTSNYAVGDVADVTVVSIMPFGAFAQVIPGVDGLIHISQIANKKLATPAEVLKKGDVVKAKILEIDTENKKVSLSVRALLNEENEAAAPAEDAE